MHLTAAHDRLLRRVLIATCLPSPLLLPQGVFPILVARVKRILVGASPRSGRLFKRGAWFSGGVADRNWLPFSGPRALYYHGEQAGPGFSSPLGGLIDKREVALFADTY
jgi:hypothetical protein